MVSFFKVQFKAASLIIVLLIDKGNSQLRKSNKHK